jgi:hypothetical protein
VELVPSQASPERNFKQSSPSAFGGPHLFGKCGALACAIRDAEGVTLLRATALKESEAGRRVAHRPVALPKNEALLASLFEQPVELKIVVPPFAYLLKFKVIAVRVVGFRLANS